MEKEKLISIVVPVYNCEKTIKRTLDSILTQLDKESELVIVNDGSLDNSLIVINEIVQNNKNVKVINSINQGSMIARKVGTENSNGKYIWYVDGGDEILDNSINIIIETIKNNENVDIFYVNHQTFHNGKIEFHTEKYKYIKEKENILLGTSPLSLCFRVIKKELLKNITAYNIKEKMTLLEDGVVSIETCFKSNNILLIDNYCYRYNIEDNSQSRSKSGVYSLLLGVKHIYNFINKYYPSFKEEVNYFVFNNTINRIVFGNDTSIYKNLYDFYLSFPKIESKYIKMKTVCELIAKFKVKNG